jgi:hypothetical protein
MKLRRSALLAAVSCGLGLAACIPEDACDPGYIHDHGFCYKDAGLVYPTVDGSSEDGGESPGNPNATFGTPCDSQDDCGGIAPVCGGPELPICTNINCLDDRELCPSDWQCLDIKKYGQLPGIDSVCVDF